MLALPPPISSRTAVFVVARRRGWSTAKIGLAIGISSQAVCQRLDRYQRYFGRIETERKSHFKGKRPLKVLVSRVCRFCGSEGWPSSLDKDKKYYCSAECFRASYQMDDSVPVQAMEMRQSGASWKHIAKISGFSYQSIQRKIWLHLAAHGMLTSKVIGHYWYPQGLRRHSPTTWLEELTGLQPR
jgi:hypothetical protein